MTARTILHYTDSADFGGAEQALLHLLAGLDRRRWRSLLVYHPAPGLAPLLEGARRLGVPVLPAPPLPLGRTGARRIPGFVGRIRGIKPDVFHAHLTWPLACKYGLLSAILARVPVIVATLQLFVDLPYDRSTRLQQRLIARGIGRYIAVSRESAARLRDAFRLPAGKIEVIHNAVPTRPFARAADPELHATQGRGGPPVVLTVARLDAQKGLPYLLEAATLVPEAAFVIAGDGPERARLEALARDLGLGDRLVFLGRRGDIPALLASCDLFVLPSLYEGLPLAVLEAMAAGKPVVATAIGGTDEAVAHGETGWLVPPGDPAALAGAIRALLADPPLARRLAKAGNARLRREFSAETMVARVEALYDALGGWRGVA